MSEAYRAFLAQERDAALGRLLDDIAKRHGHLESWRVHWEAKDKRKAGAAYEAVVAAHLDIGHALVAFMIADRQWFTAFSNTNQKLATKTGSEHRVKGGPTP